MSHLLIRLIYVSTLKSNIDESEVRKIHKTAHDFNFKNSISGIFIFGNDCFVQCLEGDREIVNRLYSKICLDGRHERIMLVSCEEISERSFSQWAMKLVMLTEKTAQLVYRYSSTGDYGPYHMSAASLFKFLLALSDVEA